MLLVIYSITCGAHAASGIYNVLCCVQRIT